MIERAVVLAGGGGRRLWPWTSAQRPKPLLPLGGGGRSLLGATLARLEPLVPRDRIAVQARAELGQQLLAAEDALDAAQLSVEPSARDTGPAVALAMHRVVRETPQAVVAVLPADHRVEDEEAFREALEVAGRLAEAGSLVLLGVQPSEASSEFGYLVLDEKAYPGRGALLAGFVEKPPRERAETLLAGGRALWNAGIFVWRADAFWGALEMRAPRLAEAVAAYDDGDEQAWERTPRRSIDYELLERASGLRAVPLDAGWSDIGGWEAVLALARRGDAGPIAELPCPSSAAPGSFVLRVEDTPLPEPVQLAGGEALAVVAGPAGLLITPRRELHALKTSLGA